jgi:hypothetical protein
MQVRELLTDNGSAYRSAVHAKSQLAHYISPM